MKYKYKCLYELTGKIEDVATFLVPITDLPPQREFVGLTDEEIEQLHTAWVLGGGFRQLCNAIETKLKEKNNV